MLKSLSIIFLACGISYAVDLGVVNVNAEVQDKQIEQNAFESVFEEPEYYENSEQVNSMPSQKHLTTKEAMFIPGVQGDPVKAIQSLSGITSMGDTSGEIFIYGSKPEESITTINHLPIGYLFHMGGLHSVVAPNAIEQIDAYMAGFDATYGNAMGGVINITPKYPDNTFNGYGHMGIYDSSAGINVPINENLSFYLGARRSYIDLVLGLVGKATGTIDEDLNTTYTEFPNYYDITFMMKYQQDSNNLYSIELISAGDSLEIASQKDIIKDPEAAGNVKQDIGFSTLGVRHQASYSNYESNTLLYSKYEHQNTELFDGYFLKVDSYESGVYHQSTFSLDSHKLVAGIELQNFFTPLDLNISKLPSPDNPDFDFTTEKKYKIDKKITVNTATLFLEDIYTLSDSLLIRYGGRFSSSDYNQLKSYFDPRFSILKSLDSVNNISFSTGIYTQIPHGFRIIKDLGNPNATYERAEHYVLHYDNSYVQNLTFNIDGYYKKYKDLLINDVEQTYLNDGKGYAYGVDLNLKVRANNYYAFAAYTYLKSKRQLNTSSDTLHRFYGEIPQTLQLIGGVKFLKDFAFSTRVNYHSGAPYTKVIDTYAESGTGRIRPIYEDPFHSRLPDYFTLNVKIAQEIKYADNSSFEWSFEIMNLTNHENISEIKYDDSYKKDGYIKQLPLLPWFDVTYRF